MKMKSAYPDSVTTIFERVFKIFYESEMFQIKLLNFFLTELSNHRKTRLQLFLESSVSQRLGMKIPQLFVSTNF